MKKFRVTVNGKTYDVSVEDLGEHSSNKTSAVQMPTEVLTEEPEEDDNTSVQADAGGIEVKAHMPGNILDVKVSVGSKVEANSVVVVLEAMKMENEIVTPVGGTVTSVNVNKGAAVNSGDILITVSE